MLFRSKEGLDRTRKVAFGRIATLFGATQITADTWEELEAILVQADMGLETSESILKALRAQVEKDGLTAKTATWFRIWW